MKGCNFAFYSKQHLTVFRKLSDADAADDVITMGSIITASAAPTSIHPSIRSANPFTHLSCGIYGETRGMLMESVFLRSKAKLSGRELK